MKTETKTMRITHVFDKTAVQVFEKDGFRITALEPFKRFRGLDIPWDNYDNLQDESEHVAKFSGKRKVIHLAAGQYGLPVESHVKRYEYKSLLKLILRAGSKSRARVEFDLGWQLLSKKIKTPRPVWMAEKKNYAARCSVLATESIPESESALERWMRCVTDRQRLELLTAIGQFTAMLHDAGFCHNDYKARHLLIRYNRPSRSDDFHVIDLLGGSFPRVLSMFKRGRNLHQMIRSFVVKKEETGFTPEHRHILLKAYFGSAPDARDWEKWMERIGKIKGQNVG